MMDRWKLISAADRADLQHWAERGLRYNRGAALRMKRNTLRLIAYADALETLPTKKRRWQLLFCAVIAAAVILGATRRQHHT